MTALSVAVDLSAGTPPYEQIRQQIAAHVSAGALSPGDRLPTIRVLAADLGVAVGTVARAYRELEGQRLVSTRRRTGTVVRCASTPASESLRQAAANLAAQAMKAGLDAEELLSLVRGALLAVGDGSADDLPSGSGNNAAVIGRGPGRNLTSPDAPDRSSAGLAG